MRAGTRLLPLVALLAAAAAILPALASDLSCEVCGKAITGRYVEVDGKAYHLQCYEEHRAPRCAVCGRPILESRIVWEGKNYHTDCFRDAVQLRCAACGKPIEGQYVSEAGRNYHPACLRSRAPKCVVCGEPLEGTYLSDGWGNPFHARHGEDLLCPFCNRVMTVSTTRGSFISSANGMRICALCARRAVSRRGEAAAIIGKARRRIHDLFPVPEDSFTWELVDKLHLIDLEPPGRNPGDELGITLGERMRRGGKTLRKIHVSILSGLPDWLLEAVAAHELAHVWQQLQDLDSLAPEEAEGSAEYAAYLVLKAGGTEEGRVKITAMKESRDPAYGIGFRKALRLAGGEAHAARVRLVLQTGRGWPARP